MSQGRQRLYVVLVILVVFIGAAWINHLIFNHTTIISSAGAQLAVQLAIAFVATMIVAVTDWLLSRTSQKLQR